MKRKGNLGIGSKVNHLTITGVTTKGVRKELHWLCSCDCGSDKVVAVRNSQLISGVVKSCGCYAAERRNMSGLGSGWKYKCDVCGSEFIALSTKQTVCSVECRYKMYEGRGDVDSCWEWKGPLNNQGYGVLSIKSNGVNSHKELMSAHRYAYAKYHCEPSAGTCVMHTCDNRKCTNPRHLVLGTWADNNADRSAKGRSGTRNFSEAEKEQYSVMLRGTGNANAKLTDDEARMIKYHHKNETASSVAARYGISRAVVSHIRTNRSWKHI